MARRKKTVSPAVKKLFCFMALSRHSAVFAVCAIADKRFSLLSLFYHTYDNRRYYRDKHRADYYCSYIICNPRQHSRTAFLPAVFFYCLSFTTLPRADKA
jgi:hypothetical protein